MRFENPLVLGAGPAGCAAAIMLARSGHTPVIIERAVDTGDALCGGFLSWQSLGCLDTLGAPDLGGHPVTELRVFHEGDSATARLPGRAIGVSRHRLDSVLQDVARAQGVDLRRGISAKSWTAGTLTTDAGALSASALFLATGKHDVRGLARPSPVGDAPLGLRVRIAPQPGLQRLIGDAIELHLFAGGYAGLLLQEDGSANLCMALRKSRLSAASSDVMTLMRQLGNDHPQLGERLAYLSGAPHFDAIGGVPYGWRATTTERGLFRLGDQAAVIPSLAGEGMGIALASGIAAAAAFARGGGDAAPSYQARFAQRTRRPVRAAAFLWHRAEQTVMARLAVPLLDRIPVLAAIAARLTRLGD